MPSETGPAAPEPKEPLEPASLARRLSVIDRLKNIGSDKGCREAGAALFRTGVNALFTVGDFIPGVGEAGSWTADGLKTVRRVWQMTGRDPRWLDLTPDVSWKVAIGSEALEYVSFGTAPTHGIEASMQFFGYDKTRIKLGAERAIKLWRGEKVEELEDYAKNKEAIDRASQSFGVDPASEFKTAEDVLSVIPKPLL